MTKPMSTIQLPFTSSGWNEKFEVCQLVSGKWIDKGAFSGREALDRFIADGFFEGREVAVFQNGILIWSNI